MELRKKAEILEAHGVSQLCAANIIGVSPSSIFGYYDADAGKIIPRSNIDNLLSRAFRNAFGFDPLRDMEPQDR